MSKLTKNYRVTIPAAVRRALHLEAGDAIAFDVEGGDVRLRKICSQDLDLSQSVEKS